MRVPGPRKRACGRTAREEGHGRHVRGTGLAGALAAVAICVVLAGCGGQGTATSREAAGQTQAQQVMTQVTRGDLIETVMARAELTSLGDDPTATCSLAREQAAEVANGQSVTIVFGMGRQGRGGAGSNPRTGASDTPDGTAPSPGAGASATMPAVGFEDGVAGTVLSVVTGDDEMATVRVSLDVVPDDVAVGDEGMAQIVVGILAEDVLLIPAAAVQGSGDGTYVQVIVDGETQKREVTVGEKTAMQCRILSGLAEGDGVVYDLQVRMTQSGGAGPAPGGGMQGSPPPGTDPGNGGAGTNSGI